jgi:hypothetical protein
VENIEKQVREQAKKLLAEGTVDVVVGYEKGTLPFQTIPCFITNPDDAERLVWNRFCSVNLAKYVHDIIFAIRHPRYGPSRRSEQRRPLVSSPRMHDPSLVIHLQEKQYDRDQVVIIESLHGIHCQ